MEVTFKFDEYDCVKTPFGEIAFIGFCGYSGGTNRYQLELPNGKSDWFYECQLELAGSDEDPRDNDPNA